ncbi:hypothetical protein BOX15_Mlig019315g1 [Macrostomum lignano]|uniref:Uncharacterized protein n=1 Tax=Macrostomum lignano TaxID=282301 RepID=A0A267GF07_9PLAT|nr:hypothetical protein BOX15_Mlig019315g1 [Macrostomum lignano]
MRRLAVRCCRCSFWHRWPFSAGCMDTTTCARQPQSTARDLCDNAGQTCYSCCRDRSYCNSGTRPAIDLRQVVVALAIACCLPGLRA